MHTENTRKVYVQTGDGRDLDDLTVTFRVVILDDYDTGYEVEARWHRAYIHNHLMTRDVAIAMCGETEVDRVERETAKDVATNWRDFVPEAAE